MVIDVKSIYGCSRVFVGYGLVRRCGDVAEMEKFVCAWIYESGLRKGTNIVAFMGMAGFKAVAFLYLEMDNCAQALAEHHAFLAHGQENFVEVWESLLLETDYFVPVSGFSDGDGVC